MMNRHVKKEPFGQRAHHASLVHDALYQYLFSISIPKKDEDNLFHEMLIESGFSGIMAKMYHLAVRYILANSTLSDYMIYFSKIVIPTWIHSGLCCPEPFGLMQICSRQICAGIQAPWMNLDLPSMALDTCFPAGMTGLRINLTK
jgi:hypothetical protein